MWLPFRRRPRGTRAVLARYLEPQALTRVVQETPDRRHLIEAVAHAAGRTESEIVEAVADYHGLPVLVEPVTTDIEIVAAQGGGLTIAEFRRIGVLPIVREGLIRELVCVDPEVVDSLPSYLRELPLSVASWELIARSLYESEKEHRDREELRSQEEVRQLEDAARAVLSTIITEADGYLSPQVEIRFEGSGAAYYFTTSDGRRASGEIHSLVTQPLQRLLVELSKGAHPVGISFPPAWQQGEFRVSFEEAAQSWIVARHGRGWGTRPPLRARAEVPNPTTGDGGGSVASVEQPSPSRATPPVAVSASASSDDGKIVPFPTTNSLDGAHRVEERRMSAPPTILIVDDNPTFARVLERFFARNETATCHASSGAAALEMLLSGAEPPALIVCDVHMPLMNGVEFLRRLRQQFPSIPAVMLTSDTDVELEIELLAAGADAFVRKQDDPRLLWVHVKRLLHRRSAA